MRIPSSTCATISLHPSTEELGQGGAVARRRFTGECLCERRGSRIGDVTAERCRDAMPRDTSMLVADAVVYGLAQVGGERVWPARREARDASNGAEQDVVDDVGGVGGGARPAWEASVCPTMEPRQVAAVELVQRVGVAVARAAEEPPGRAARGPLGGTVEEGRRHRPVLTRRHRGMPRSATPRT